MKILGKSENPKSAAIKNITYIKIITTSKGIKAIFNMGFEKKSFILRAISENSFIFILIYYKINLLMNILN